jgi:hypothetical protein
MGNSRKTDMCVWSCLQDADLLSAKPLKKASVCYHPTDEAITDDVLAKVAGGLGPEWVGVAASLGIKKTGVQVLQRNAMLEGKAAGQLKYEMLMMWVKTLAKSEDKVCPMMMSFWINVRHYLLNCMNE